MLVPSTDAVPSTNGSSPTMARPIVVFPEPDSPTRPTTSPCSMVKLTPSTARNAGDRPRLGYSMATSRRSTTSSASVVALGFVVGLEVGGHDCPEVRDGAQEALGVLVSWGGEHLGGVALLDDLAALHHEDAVGEIGDDAHVVGDEEDAGVDAVAKVADELEDLGLHGHVERRGRLVGDEHGGIARQRLGDHRPLPLTTGELVRVGVHAALRRRDLDEVEQLDHPLARQLRRHRLVAAEHLGDLEADRVDGVERGHRLLEDHRHDAAAHRAQRPGVEADDLEVAEADRSAHRGVLRQQAHHGQGDRRLARSRLADDGQRLTGAQVEVGLADGGVPGAVDPEVDGEVAHRDDGQVGFADGPGLGGADRHRGVLSSALGPLGATMAGCPKRSAPRTGGP